MNLAHDIADRHKSLAASLPRGMGVMLVASVALACWGAPASAQHGEKANNARLVGMHNLQARSAYHGVIQEQEGRWSPISATTAAPPSIR